MSLLRGANNAALASQSFTQNHEIPSYLSADQKARELQKRALEREAGIEVYALRNWPDIKKRLDDTRDAQRSFSKAGFQVYLIVAIESSWHGA